MDALSFAPVPGVMPYAVAQPGAFAAPAYWPSAPAYQPDAYTATSLPGFLMPAPAYAPSSYAEMYSLQLQIGALVNEVEALMQSLGQQAPSPAPSPAPAPVQAGAKATFNVSSFNVLGNSHTQKGAEEPWMDPGVVRIRRAVQLLQQHKVDVVGFQEMQAPQMKEFQRVAGSQFATYPGLADKAKNVENSIAWRKDKFDLVQAHTFKVPYFDGNQRNMPYVLLRDKQTGKECYVINVHNPADTAKHHNQQGYRTQARANEIALINRLKQTGLPVIFTGDMNEGDHTAIPVTRDAGMHASSGAVPSKERSRGKTGIDWIFGSQGVSFSHYVKDRGAVVKKTTDHPVIVSTATI